MTCSASLSWCTITSIALLDTCGTSSWVPVAMPYRLRTARMSRSRRANECGSCELGGQRAVEADAARHLGQRLGRVRPVVHQVVRGPVDPAGVAVASSRADLLAVQGQRPDQIPAGQGEHPRLQALNMASSRCACLICSTCSSVSLAMLGEAQRGGDDRRGGRGDAVLGEGRVVRRRRRRSAARAAPAGW